MLLSEFGVHNYRNVLDSTPIKVEEDVTCLVGKNEAGKSALLQALYRLNPAHATPFDLNEQYPRWLLTQDRRRGITDEVEPIRAVFTLKPTTRKPLRTLLDRMSCSSRRSPSGGSTPAGVCIRSRSMRPRRSPTCSAGWM